jgi:hypothetical protein
MMSSNGRLSQPRSHGLSTRRWLNAAPRSRIAVICSICVVGLIFAFRYDGNTNSSPGSAPPVQTSGVIPAQSSTNSKEWFANEDPGWSYLGTNPASRSARVTQTSGWSYLGTNPRSRSVVAMQTSGAVGAQASANPSEWLAKEGPGWSSLSTWDEPSRSSALASRLSSVETAPPDPGIIGVKSWARGDSASDAAVAKPVAVKDDSWEREGGPFSMALASDYSVGAGDSEDEKAAMRKGSIRDKDKVKKTTKRSVKRPQRSVTSRDRDRGFSPLQAVQRVRERIRRVIRRIL